jgi:hypothetical protein
MSEQQIRGRITLQLSQIPGMGIVHGFQRWADTWPKFLDHFKTNEDRIHGWIVTRTRTAQRQTTMGAVERAHVFLIRGVYGLKDDQATELTFQALVDSIVEKFTPDSTLDGACETTHPDWGPMANAAGLQADTVEHRMFGKVLCHYAECRLCAVERVIV